MKKGCEVFHMVSVYSFASDSPETKRLGMMYGQYVAKMGPRMPETGLEPATPADAHGKDVHHVVASIVVMIILLELAVRFLTP